MVLDGLRGYLQLATGLTDVTRERARAAARTLVAQGGAGVDAVVPAPVKSQVTTLTEDLLATSKANRDLLVHLVRGEVERSVARLGLVSKADLDAERRRADRLEAKVRELETKVPAPQRTAAKKSTAKTSTTKKSTAKTSAAKRSATTSTPKAGA
jgi:polyhydroxyalkanoate synthesis regulator phasin